MKMYKEEHKVSFVRSPKSGLASLPPADWSFRILRPSSFRRKLSDVTCLSDAMQPILLCGTCVMGPELSRITSASISLSLTCSSSPGLFFFGWDSQGHALPSYGVDNVWSRFHWVLMAGPRLGLPCFACRLCRGRLRDGLRVLGPFSG